MTTSLSGLDFKYHLLWNAGECFLDELSLLILVIWCVVLALDFSFESEKSDFVSCLLSGSRIYDLNRRLFCFHCSVSQCASPASGSVMVVFSLVEFSILSYSMTRGELLHIFLLVLQTSSLSRHTGEHLVGNECQCCKD